MIFIRFWAFFIVQPPSFILAMRRLLN